MTDSAHQLPFSEAEYARRVRLVREALSRAEVDTAVLTAPDTIAWITGYRSRWYRQHTSTALPPMHALLVDRSGELCALVEIEYHRDLARETSMVRDFRAVPATAADGEPTLDEWVTHVVRNLAEGGRNVGLERWSCIPNPFVSGVLGTALVAAGHALSDISIDMRRIRKIKSIEEIAVIRRAQAACDAGIEGMLRELRPEMTGLEAWGHYSLAMVRAGGEPAALHETVAGGSSVSAIHALSGRIPLGNGSVVYPDMAAAVHGYHARATRPVSFGQASVELLKLVDHAVGALDVFRNFGLPGREWAELAAAIQEYSAHTGIELGLAGYELGVTVPPADWVGEFVWSSVAPPAGRIETGLVTNIELFNGANLVDTVLFTEDGPELLSSLPMTVLEAKVV